MAGVRILFLIGFIAYSSAWKVGQQLEYDYRGGAFVSVYDLKDKFSINELKGKLIIQAVDEETLTVQLAGVTAGAQAAHNGNPYHVGDFDFRLSDDAEKLAITDSQSLERPFQIKHKNGAVQNIQVAEADPVWAVNVKKAIASALQLDLKSITDQSVLVKEILYGNEDEANVAIDVFENSILGNCLTSLRVTKLAGAQVVTNKNYKYVEQYCASESPVYELHKQVDLDSCKNIPILNYVMPPLITCKPGRGRCGNSIQYAAGARYYACKVPEGGWKVIRGDYYNDYLVAPFGSKSEELFAGGFVSVLLTSSGQIGTPLAAPSSPVVHTSLAYSFPDAMDSHGNLRQPSFEDAPLSRPADILSKKSYVLSLLRTVADELSRNAADSSTKSFDFANKLIEVRRFVTQLKLSEIRDIAKSVAEDETTTVRHLLIDILATAGTPATAKFVADLLRKGKLGNMPSAASATDVAMMLFNYVNLPTKELLADLLDLVKTLETGQVNEDVHATSLMGMAELLFHACASSFMEERRFPAAAYGSFCSIQDEVYKEFVTYLTGLLDKASTNFEKMAYLTVAGTLGTKDAFPLLLPFIRGVKDQSPAVRTRAVLSLHRYAYASPEKVLPIVDALYGNTAEQPEVRMAALAILLNSNAPYSTWQKVAWQTWFEPNNQVASFTASLVSNLAGLPEADSQYAELVKKAKTAAHILQPAKKGAFFSHSTHIASWFEDADAGYLLHKPVWRSGYQSLPVATGLRLASQRGPHIFTYFQVYKWSYGQEELIEKIRLLFAKPVKQSRPREINFAQADLDALLNKLGVEKRAKDEINTFIQAGVLGNMHRLTTFDNFDKTLPKTLKLINEAISSDAGYDLKIQKFRSWTDILMSRPTVLGVATSFEASLPSLQSSHAKVKGHVNAPFDFNVNVDGNTFVSWSYVAKLGIEFPFTNSYVAAGVDARTQIKLPKSMGVALNVKDLETIDFQFTVTPSESERTILLNKVTPFLVAGRSDDFSPLTDKSGYSVVHTTEPVVKSLSPSPLLPITLTTESPDDEVPSSKYSLSFLNELAYPTTLRSKELRIGFSPRDTKLPQVKIGLQTARTRKYYADNFTYVESGTGSKAPRPRATPLGGYDLEADSEIGGGWSINEKLTLTIGNKEAASLNLNVAQDFDHSLRKFKIVVKSGEFVGCAKFRQVAPIFSKFENSPADIQSKLAVTFGKGEDCADTTAKGEIVLSRSDKQLLHAVASKAYVACAAEIAEGITDSVDCSAARRLSDTYDKVSVNLQGYDKSELLKKFVAVLSSGLRARKNTQLSLKRVQDDGTFTMDVSFATDGKKYDVFSRHDGEEVTIKNVPVFWENLVPFNARKNLWDYMIEHLTRGAENPTCHVSAKRIQTFDGVTYDYAIDDCQHLVASDCSGKSKFAVLLSKKPEKDFAVQVITEGDRFEITSSGVVDLNKKKVVNLDENGIGIVSSDYVVTTLYKRATGDYVLISTGSNIFIYFRGSMVTIKAGMEHSGKLCGLCGDNNHEQSREFFDPKRCAVRSGALMAASFRVHSDSCSPLPAEVEATLTEHRKNCKSVDAIVRTALPVASDICKLKRSKGGHEAIVCNQNLGNGNEYNGQNIGG